VNFSTVMLDYPIVFISIISLFLIYVVFFRGDTFLDKMVRSIVMIEFIVLCVFCTSSINFSYDKFVHDTVYGTMVCPICAGETTRHGDNIICNGCNKEIQLIFNDV